MGLLSRCARRRASDPRRPRIEPTGLDSTRSRERIKPGSVTRGVTRAGLWPGRAYNREAAPLPRKVATAGRQKMKTPAATQQVHKPSLWPRADWTMWRLPTMAPEMR